MSTYAKYMDRFKRIRSASSDSRPELSFRKNFMVDRETYTKFMEQEMEKVGAVFMQVKNLPERVEQLQNQIILNQEKFSNVSRILNLIQETENSQENDIKEIKGALRKLGVNSNAAKDREYTQFKITGAQDQETNDLINRIRKLEDRISYPLSSKVEKLSISTDLASKMDRSLLELEERLVQMISERLPKDKKSHRSKSRSKSPGSTSIKSTKTTQNGQNLKIFEKSVNKWT